MKINFAHNVYDRPNRLRDTIRIERELFPDCGIFVAYNNLDFEKHINNPETMCNEFKDVVFDYFSQPDHKIGCVNGAYLSINMALHNNPDVIIFSHDDVYISNPVLVRKNIDDIIGGRFDFIGRTPSNLPDIGTEYIMMEAMFFSNRGARSVYDGFKPFLNEENIEKDLRGSVSPEVNMNNLVKKLNELKINKMYYMHVNNPLQYNVVLDGTLGFTHENIGRRGWKE